MKKLMTVLASTAAALFAFGAGADLTTTGSSVESSGYVVGQNLVSTTTDPDEDEVQRQYWYIATADGGDNGVVVSNYEASATTTPIGTRPEKFKDDVNTQFLALDTSSPLYRTALPNGQDPSAFSGATIGTDGIYLDTLVKFTAADDVFGEDALEKDVDKIAISYVEQGDDVENPITNFVIRAGGLVNEEFGVVNYIAHLADGSTFDKDQWHRLTVRAIANVGDGQAGFIVYLDGNPDKFLAYDASIDAGFDNVSALYAEKYYNSTVRAIYPSAVNVGDNKTTITAASFSGTGAIDDVVFTAVKPEFITESPKVTFTWGEGVTALTIGNKTLSDDELAAGEIIVDLVGATISVTATVDSSDGKVARYTTTGDGAWDSTNGQFTGLVAGDTCNIAAIVPAFEVGGIPYTIDELADVLTIAATGTQASPVTVKLAANCNQLISLGEGEYDPEDAAYVVLDLNGHDIQGGELDDFSVINNGVNLTIINSGSAASVKVPTYEQASGVLLAGLGFTTIEAGTYEGTVIAIPDDEEEGTVSTMLIKGGSFLDTAYVEESVFYLAGFVQSGLAVTYDSATQYVQVGGGTPQPTTYDVTYTPPANATVVTDPATVTGLEAGDTVGFTVTPATGYTYTGVTLGEGWTLADGSITMTYTVVAGENAVTIPDPVEIVTPDVFDITYSGADNATVVTDPAELEDLEVNSTVTFTATPDTGYTYEGVTLGDWVRNSETGAISYTLKVTREEEVVIPDAVAEQQGGYPTYIDTTDADAKAKYDAWKVTYGADTESAYEEAFLLNCSTDAAVVAAEKAAFKFTKIAFEGGVWVVETTTKNTANADYNGTVTIKRYSDVGCTTPNEEGSFFKAELK